MEYPTRIVILGDELIAGAGDPRALGWVGRVLSRTHLQPGTVTMALPMPGEPLGRLVNRWEAETLPRLSHGADNRVIIGVGAGDAREGTSTARSRLSLANIVDGLHNSGASCLVVGPPPLPDVDELRLQALSHACGDVCRRRQIPYVETFSPLLYHEQWLADVRQTGLPAQAGYGLLAWLVLHERWHEWIGCPESQ